MDFIKFEVINLGHTWRDPMEGARLNAEVTPRNPHQVHIPLRGRDAAIEILWNRQLYFDMK